MAWQYKERNETVLQTAARMYKDYETQYLWERIANTLKGARKSGEQDVIDHYTKVWTVLKGYNQPLIKLESNSLYA